MKRLIIFVSLIYPLVCHSQGMEKVKTYKEFMACVAQEKLGLHEIMNYPVLFPVKRNDYTSFVNSKFGKRNHPVYKVVRNHTGVDIAEPKGTPVYSAGNGKIVKTGYNKGYGYYIEVEHSHKFVTLYGHLSKILVKKGQQVVCGEHIGNVGSTGVSTGPHLHYEVKKNGIYLNPEDWCYCLMKILEEIKKKQAENYAEL